MLQFWESQDRNMERHQQKQWRLEGGWRRGGRKRPGKRPNMRIKQPKWETDSAGSRENLPANLKTNNIGTKMRQTEKKQKQTWEQKQSTELVQRRTKSLEKETRKKKKKKSRKSEDRRDDFSHTCHFFSCSLSISTWGLWISPGQPTVGIYSPVGRPANKTHVDLQRNGEGQGPENSLSLCPST